MIAYLELIVGQIEACFAALLAFEAWTAGTPCKKRSKRLPQVQERLVRGIFRDVPGPGELLASNQVEVLLEFPRGGFLACLILSIPFGQRPVPHKAAGSCGTGKVIGLFMRGVQADFVRANHQQFPLQVTQNL